MTEELLTKFDNLIVSEEANSVNQLVAQNLLCRKEQGIFESLSDLIQTSLVAYPDEDRATNVLVQLAERIHLKAVTSPLNLHLQISNQILMSLLESTDATYHSKIAESIMKMIEALYLELKNMKQEPFKKKVLNKLCPAISMITGYSNATTCLEVIKK